MLPPPEKQTARVAVEKRPKGKVATVIRGLKAADNDFPALLTALKSACGAGGSIEGETLELQGDHAKRLQQLLAARGYRVK